MPVETANFISQLNPAYPLGSDDSGDGDNHLRLIKSILKAQFPAFTAEALDVSQAQLEAAVSSVTGLAKLLLLAGSAGAPGLAVVGDEDTGLYSPGANQIAVTVGGLLAVLIGSDKSLTAQGKIISTGAGKGFDGPGCVPVGAVIEWYADALPDATKYGVYAWANGATVSAATYTELAALWPTRVSGGNITLPDRRDNVVIGKATMGGAADPGRISTYDTTALWAQVGEGSHLLLLTEVPAHDHGGYTGYTNVDHTHGYSYIGYSLVCPAGSGAILGYGSPIGVNGTTSSAAAQGYDLNHRHTIASAGSSQAHNIVQPGMVCNFIVRIA